MALLILNCSVDMPDAMPESVAEDLAINDMESMIEILLEKVLGFEDAIAEYDDYDNEDGYAFDLKKSLDFFVLPLVIFIRKENSHKPYTKHIANITAINTFFNQFIGNPISPPPQLA